VIPWMTGFYKCLPLSEYGQDICGW
jgi:hypothetical protein